VYFRWGDPKEKDYFEYMLSYSPYENVGKKDYPTILVECGVNDPRVQFWEPIKWVAKLRETKKGKNPVLLKIIIDTGHYGASGRYDSYKEEAFYFAFMLDQWGLLEQSEKNK